MSTSVDSPSLKPASAMHPARPASLPLTLIVATTPSLGIGRGGTLPWPALKQDMAFFARITKRVPPPPSPAPTPASFTPVPAIAIPIPPSLDKVPAQRHRNAVIMGRKTWDSIPPRFRPLKSRLNVVITRQESLPGLDDGSRDDVLVAGSLDEAVRTLQQLKHLPILRAFVIGGASIYEAALQLPQTDRVLLTKVYHEYECDTFFPLNLDAAEGKKAGWVRSSKEEVVEWAGEEVPEGRQMDEGVEFEFCMFEKATAG